MGHWRRTTGFLLGPIFAIGLLLLPLPALTIQAHRLAAIAALVVIFWLTEVIPIPVTALLGASLAIVFGVSTPTNVFAAFGDPVIFLFIGSFMIAKAMQVHGIDQRIAYALLSHPWVGGSTRRTLWALGLTTCLLSMWMSNTACAAMLFPVALAIARTTDDLVHRHTKSATRVPHRRYTTALLLMLAYAASIGGVATPIGTPPNLIGIALIEQGTGVRLTFLQWMVFGVPVALALLTVCYLILIMLFPPETRAVPDQREAMRQALDGLGPMKTGEWNALIAFAVAVIFWVGPGLAGLFVGMSHPWVQWAGERIPEGTAALLAASLLFLLPTNRRDGKFTLRWDDAVQIDWGTVLLFGGGIALGRMMFETGLAEAIGTSLVAVLGVQDPQALTGAAVGVGILTSETSSNTASANMVVPVMLSMAKAMGISGITMGVAATLGTSMGFMLPISTPPNAIVYGSKTIRLIDMVKAGVLLDLCAFLVLWGVSVWLVPIVIH